MAERAKARGEGRDKWRDLSWERHVADLQRQGRDAVQGMTLGEAVDRLRGLAERQVACACIGPPFCCRFGYEQAYALQRAAHIAAKLVADHMIEVTHVQP